MKSHVRTILYSCVAILCIALVAGVLLFFFRNSLERIFLSILGGERFAITLAAQDAMASCARATYRPTCYDDAIPHVMDRGFTMEQAFQVTLRVQQLDSAYIYCHVLGHNLSAKETAKDPSKWTEVLARCPTGVCANGCMHGAVQQKFRTDALSTEEITRMLPQLATVCEPGPGKEFTGLERSVCYHGLGHLGMYASGGNMRTALGVCTALNERASARDPHTNLAARCYEGVFMQVFQFLDAEDRALTGSFAPKTADEADTFCATFPRAEQAACHRESWPLRTEIVKNPNALLKFCNASPGRVEEQDCFNTLFNIMVPMAEYSSIAITHFCEGLPLNRMGQCFAHAASRYIDSDQHQAPRAALICETAEKDGVGDRCYKELLYYSVYSYHADSAAFRSFCEVLPSSWKDRCLAHEGATISPYVFD